MAIPLGRLPAYRDRRQQQPVAASDKSSSAAASLTRSATAGSDFDYYNLPTQAREMVLVFGEPLRVRYEYESDAGADVSHTDGDWIGLFRILPKPKPKAAPVASPDDAALSPQGRPRPGSRGGSAGRSASARRRRPGMPGAAAAEVREEDPYVDFPASLRSGAPKLVRAAAACSCSVVRRAVFPPRPSSSTTRSRSLAAAEALSVALDEQSRLLVKLLL